MLVKEKSRPFHLELATDTNKPDMILRTVSPITSQFASLDMRDTLKISEVIRLQQNELIAAGNYENGPSPCSSARHTPVPVACLDAPCLTTAAAPSASESALDLDGKEPVSDDDSVGDSDGDSVERPASVHKRYASGSPGGTAEGSEIERIAGAFSKRTLQRSNVPAPLRISPTASGASMAPVINSAPMRSLYGSQGLRRVPVRYLYPAVHYVPTPVYRAVPAGPDRVLKPRLPRATSARRRKPVLDVFEGQVAKLAPLPAQPPSAQIERFDVSHSDDEKATREEMDEMEKKLASAATALRGTISFNEESAFKFTLFQGNESSSKKKFLEVCETTWDTYMANSTGS